MDLHAKVYVSGHNGLVGSAIMRRLQKEGFTNIILDPDSLRNSHTYHLEFNDSSAFHDNPTPWFWLVDKTSSDTVIKLTQLLTAQQQSSIIRGMALNLTNDQAVVVDASNTKWEKGNSNLVVQIGFDSRFAPAYQPARVNYPADFEITFTAKGQGDPSFPSSSFSGPQPSNITIKNVTENIDHVQFIFQEVNNNQVFDDGDAIFIVCAFLGCFQLLLPLHAHLGQDQVAGIAGEFIGRQFGKCGRFSDSRHRRFSSQIRVTKKRIEPCCLSCCWMIWEPNRMMKRSNNGDAGKVQSIAPTWAGRGPKRKRPQPVAGAVSSLSPPIVPLALLEQPLASLPEQPPSASRIPDRP